MGMEMLTGMTKAEILLDKIKENGLKATLSDYARKNKEVSQVTEHMSDYFSDKFLEFYNPAEDTGKKRVLSALEKTIECIDNWKDNAEDLRREPNIEDIINSENMIEEIYKYGASVGLEEKKITSMLLREYSNEEGDENERILRSAEIVICLLHLEYSKPYNPTE